MLAAASESIESFNDRRKEKAIAVCDGKDRWKAADGYMELFRSYSSLPVH